LPFNPSKDEQSEEIIYGKFPNKIAELIVLAIFTTFVFIQKKYDFNDIAPEFSFIVAVLCMMIFITIN
jgi:hypothetical protein